MDWDVISGSSSYQDATPREQADIRMGYFRDYVAKTPEWKATPKADQDAYKKNFLHEGGKNLVEEKPAGTGENLSRAVKETVIQLPATAAKAASGFVKGATLGLVDLPTPNADEFLAQRRAQGNVTKEGLAGEGGQFLGTFVPVGIAVKTAQTILSPIRAAVPAWNYEVGTSALAGLLFAYVKGRTNGAQDEDIVREMGTEGLTWGAMGGLIHGVMSVLGKRAIRRAEEQARAALEAEGHKPEVVDTIISGAGKPSVNAGVSTQEYKQAGLRLRTEEGKGLKRQKVQPLEQKTPEPPVTDNAPEEVLSLFPSWRPGVKEAPLGLVPPTKKVSTGVMPGAPTSINELKLEAAKAKKPWELTAEDKVLLGRQEGQVHTDVGYTPKGGFTPEKPVVVQGKKKSGVLQAAPEARPGDIPLSEKVKVAYGKEPVHRTAEDKVLIREWESLNNPNIEAGAISLYSGIPVDKIHKTLRKVNLQIGTRRRGEVNFDEWAKLYGVKLKKGWNEKISTFEEFHESLGMKKDNLPKWGTKERDALEHEFESFLHARNGYTSFKDMGGLIGLFRGILSPSYMAQLHPSAKALSTSGITANMDKLKLVDEMMNVKREALRGLSSSEVSSLTRMFMEGDINKWNTSRDFPADTLQKVGPKVLRAYDRLRTNLFDKMWNDILVQEPGLASKTQTGYFPRMFEFFEGRSKVSRASLIRKMAEDHGLDFVQMERILDKSLSKHAAWERVMSRKGGVPSMEGRVEDLDFILNSYIYGASRRWAYNKFRYGTKFEPGFDTLLKDIENLPGVHSKMVDYVKQWQGLPMTDWMTDKGIRKTAKALGWFEFVTKIGLNIGTAAVQLLQYPLFNSAKAVGLAIKHKDGKALGDFMVGFYKPFTRSGWKTYNESMIGKDLGKLELGVEELHGFMDKSARLLGYMFLGADQYVKSAAFNQFTRTMTRQGVKQGLSGEALNVFAKRGAAELTAETQFLMGVEDKGGLFTHPIGATILRFKMYMTKSVETFLNMTWAERATFMGMLGAIGGPEAIPIVRQWKHHLEETGQDDDVLKFLNAWERESLMGQVGKVTGAVPDLYSTVGDSVFFFAPKTDHVLKSMENRWKDTLIDYATGVTGRDARVIGGALVDLYKKQKTGVLDLGDDDWKDMIGDIMASEVGSVVSTQAHRIARGTKEMEKKYIEMRRKQPGAELSDTDIAMRMMGFTSTELSKKREKMWDYQMGVQDAMDYKLILEDAVLDAYEKQDNAIESGDKEAQEAADDEVDRVRDLVQDHNRMFWEEETYLRINAESVKKAKENRMLPWEHRVARNKQELMKMRELLDKDGGR